MDSEFISGLFPKGGGGGEKGWRGGGEGGGGMENVGGVIVYKG